ARVEPATGAPVGSVAVHAVGVEVGADARLERRALVPRVHEGLDPRALGDRDEPRLLPGVELAALRELPCPRAEDPARLRRVALEAVVAARERPAAGTALRRDPREQVGVLLVLPPPVGEPVDLVAHDEDARLEAPP